MSDVVLVTVAILVALAALEVAAVCFAQGYHAWAYKQARSRYDAEREGQRCDVEAAGSHTCDDSIGAYIRWRLRDLS